ncbi:MAG: YajG family lipoprotein [Thermoanaerobaculia bacterium]
MTRATYRTIVFALLATLAVPAGAKKNNPDVQLVFLPQQAVAAAEADITPDQRRRPVQIRVADARAADDVAKIGSRTDDDDRYHTLRAVNDVGTFVGTVVDEVVEQWGIKTGDGADLVLEISLLEFMVEETNQAVGATYKANVRLDGELTGDGEWSGGSFGDASRYGKKFSNENLNEVLSDALLEALADLLSDRGLHRAWKE